MKGGPLSTLDSPVVRPEALTSCLSRGLRQPQRGRLVANWRRKALRRASHLSVEPAISLGRAVVADELAGSSLGDPEPVLQHDRWRPTPPRG